MKIHGKYTVVNGRRIGYRVEQMGEEISCAYLGNLSTDSYAGHWKSKPLVVMPVLTGAMVFCSDLIRHLDMPIEVKPVRVQSYQGKESKRIRSEGIPDVKGRDVLVVDDILDTGQTRDWLLWRLGMDGMANSVRFVFLLNKQKVTNERLDFVGFKIPDEFVVGYGLDYNGLYRNLPDVVVLDESEYK